MEVATRRTRHLDEIAEALPQRAVALARLFLRHTTLEVSRTEVGVLRAVRERPQRITELAAIEGVTQPAITSVVNRMEARGWVMRQRDSVDGRAVLVALTPLGEETFERLRAEYRALLHEEMASLDDEAVEVLARAVDVLDELVSRLADRER